MQRIIQEYLAAPQEKRKSTLTEMARWPDAALDALLAFRGPYPAAQPVADGFPDLLSPLLAAFLRQCPRVLFGRNLSALTVGQRWVLLDAAILSDHAIFTDLILKGLSDRSVQVKRRVVQGVIERPFLRSPDAREALEKMFALKSLAYCRADIQQALDSLPPIE